MIKVKLKENESVEKLLSKFKRKVKNAGIVKEYRERRYHTKASEKRRLKKKQRKKEI
jgi:ribosomal protein S21